MSDEYVLTAADLDNTFSPPIMRAASHSNPSVLKAVIKYGASLDEKQRSQRGLSCTPFWDSDLLALRYDSPLLEAITAGRPVNIALLLEAGADPNGLCLDMLSRYSAQYLRFRRHKSHVTRYEALKLIPESQSEPLTQKEIFTRRMTRARFWSSENFVSTSSVPWTAPTALETAATTGSLEILDQILDAHPDTTWWLGESTACSIPIDPLHSFLSTSTPIHAAIKAGHNDVLMYLLDKGFNPNTLPLSTITQCISPLMATIVCCEPPNLEAFDLLLSYSRTNRDQRTPIYNVHILHFATALLSPSLLVSVSASIALNNAGTTALGHTLLHVACLPLDDTYIQIFSERVYQSIHNVRTFSPSWIPLKTLPHEQSHKNGLISHYKGVRDLPNTLSTIFPAQNRVVAWLLQSSTQSINVSDTDGNSPMHYVAGHREVNEELLQMLRATDGGEDVWLSQKNMWGWTPRDLYEDGRSAVAEPYKPFWGLTSLD